MKAYFDKLYRGKYSDFMKEVRDCIVNEKKKFVVTANPETFMLGQETPEFDVVLKREHTVIVPDGIGIVKAANLLGIPIESRITGVEICEEIFRILDQEKKSIFLTGAKKEVGEALCRKLNREYPGMKVAGYVDGYVKDKDHVMEQALALKPDVILVALGIPKQEILIDQYYDQFEKGILIGVGGSFDVLSGTKKRAPKFFIKCNLEWLYRITSEPKRMKRFYSSNVKFIKRVRALKKGK